MSELRRLWRALPDLELRDATTFLMHLTRDPVFVVTRLVPALASATSGKEPSIAFSYGTRETSTCLQVFVWPAGAATPIHDHTSWGAYQCVIGSLTEERYQRLDSGAQPSTARLRKAWQRQWRQADGATTVRAYEDGIHRVRNTSSRPAVSVHLYGPRMGIFDGRDYDPTRDFVCDRLEQDELAAYAALAALL